MPATHSRFKRTLRTIMQLDRPVIHLNDAEAIAERDRNFRWNYAVNSVDVLMFMIGLSVLSATTIFPLYVSKLTDSTIPIAIIAIIAQSGFFLPQLLTANYIERLDRKKTVPVNLGFFAERVPTILLALGTLLALRSPNAALIIFLLAYAWFQFGAGAVAVGWQDLIARCFPVEWRGRFFGSNIFIGTLIGIGVVSWAGNVLDSVAFPTNFFYIFGVGSLAICTSWLFLSMTREPVQAVNIPRVSTREYLSKLPQAVRDDDNFRRYLFARVALAFAEIGTGYLTVGALSKWTIADSTVAFFATAQMAGQTVSTLLMGFLADRFGHKLTTEIGTVAAMLAFILAWLAPSATLFIGVFFLLGFFAGTRTVSGTLIVMEFSSAEKRPTYIGIANTLGGIASAIAPLIGLALVKLGYSWVFFASALVSLIALLLLRFYVQEPRTMTVGNNSITTDNP